MNAQLVEHPVVFNALHHLRNKETDSAKFRHYCHLITVPLILEATKGLPLANNQTETPLELTNTKTYAESPVWIPILRAGLGMLKIVLDLFPESPVGHIGLERDGSTAIPRSYYEKLPPCDGQPVILLDPMLATGGSAANAIDLIKKSYPTSPVSLACIVAAPEGIALLNEKHADVQIFTTSIDRQLNNIKYILPGLGDFGDRYFGTVG